MDNLFQQEYATSIGGHLSAKSSSLRPLLSLLQLQRETRITWRLAAGGWRLAAGGWRLAAIASPGASARSEFPWIACARIRDDGWRHSLDGMQRLALMGRHHRDRLEWNPSGFAEAAENRL
jgi:hypothetical protein